MTESISVRRRAHADRTVRRRAIDGARRRSRRHSLTGAARPQSIPGPGGDRRRDPGLRQPGGGGQPQHRAHGGPACRLARNGAGHHGEPSMRVGARRHRARGRAACGRGEQALLLAGGAESMSRAPFVMAKADDAYSRAMRLEDTTMGWRFVNPRLKASHGVDSMPETAEAVAERYGIAREDQDSFALRSQQRAAAAQRSGRFAREIVAVPVAGRKGAITEVTADEHPRPDTTLDQLAALKPVVRPGGTVTAGNASGIKRRRGGADRRRRGGGQAPWADAACPHRRRGGRRGSEPRVMGIGPVPAVRLPARAHRPAARPHRRDRVERGVRPHRVLPACANWGWRTTILG